MNTARRDALVRRFDAARARWLSLDVFDTLLARALERPTDAFREVHRRLGACAVSSDAFTRMRIDAEAAARRAHPSREICIEEICAELARALGGRVDAAALAQAELETERALVELDRDIAALVHHAAERGVPYIVVSDMYLRAEHLLELITGAAARAGVELPAPAHVFVSGEQRANKSGELFDRIVATLGCAAQEIFHVGDHPVSDVESPRRRGIGVFHYARENGYATAVYEREQRWLAAPAGDSDFGLRTARCKALAAAHAGADERVSHFHYGAFVLGPLFSAFAEWVVAQCARRGQRTVYCLMREAHLLAPLVQRAARALSYPLDVRKLWVSRYALRAASFREASVAELEPYFRKRRGVSIEMAASDLGVDEGLLRRHSGIDRRGRMDAGEIRRVLDALSGVRELRLQVLASAIAKRRRYLSYLEANGVLAQDELTLVDLGWGGRMQKMFARLLEGLSCPRHLQGLYLATTEVVLELPLDRCTADGFLFHLGKPEKTCAALWRSPEIMELACMPREGSLRGFDEANAAVLFPQLIAPEQLAQMEELQRGILHFAEYWLPGAPRRHARMSHADWQGLLARLRATLARAHEDPLAAEAALFERWVHDDNDGSANIDPLLGNAAVRARARFMPGGAVRRLSSLDCFWPQGLAALVDREPAWARVVGSLFQARSGRG